MPRVCSVCADRRRGAIDQALVAGASYRSIAKQYGLSEPAVYRHKATHLPQGLVQAREVRDVARADEVLAALHEGLERLRRLSDACDRWLRDPDDPDRYTVEARADEIRVTYEEIVGGRRVRQTAPLSELLGRLTGSGVRIIHAESTAADPRTLILETGAATTRYLALLVDVLDKLHNVQEMERFEAAVLEAIGEAAPDVRDRIIGALRAHAPGVANS